jgi:hypothetical protein
MAIYNTYFSVLGLQDSLGVLPNLGVLPGLGRLDDLGEYAFSPTSLFLNGEQGVWYDPSDLTPEKVSWRRNLLTYSQDFENAAWTKSNASILSNLALYSQDFDNAAWVKTEVTATANAIAAPDGTTTADRFLPSTNNVSHYWQLTLSSAGGCTGSVYVKLDGSGVDKVTLYPGGAATFAHFNLTNLTTTREANCSASSIVDAGNGWYRCIATWPSSITADRLRVYAGSGATGDLPYAGSGTTGPYFWGAQVVPGSTAQTYTRSLATAAPIQFADPLGGTLADKLVENTATSTHRLVTASTITVSSGATVTNSVFVKAAERTWAVLSDGGSSGVSTIYFNLANGTFGTVGVGVTQYSATNLGSGWYRIQYTCVLAGAVSQPFIGVASADNTNSYTGDGVSGIYVFGAQVEQASTASAYQRITDFSSNFLAAFPTHALYQESTGVTPVTALGQSVGLVLDKRLGALTNLGPAITSEGYTSTGSVSDNGNGTYTIQPSSTMRFNFPLASLENGATYLVTIPNVLTSGTGSSVSTDFVDGTSATIPNGGWSGTFKYISSRATYDSTFRFVDITTGGTVATIIGAPRLNKVPGNHALQATSASRPTVQARANLLTYSEQFDNAAWGKTNGAVTANGAVAPDGTTTADAFIENTAAGNHYIGQSPTVLAGSHTFSVYYKLASGTRNIALYHAGVNQGRQFDASGNSSAGAFNAPAGFAVTAVGNGWYRASITVSLTASSSEFRLWYSDASNALSYTGDGTSGYYLWGAQVDAASTASTYQRVVTATDYADVGLPRNLLFDGIDDSLATVGNVDFATWTGSEARRNLLTMPSMFDDAAWTKQASGVTFTANTTTSPDGTVTADLATEDLLTTSKSIYQTPSATGAGAFTGSVYVKANAGTRFMRVVVSSAATNFSYVTVNISTGAVTQSATAVGTASNASAVVTNAGNGWYRIALTTTLAATPNFVFFVPLDSGTAAASPTDYGREQYTGNGSSWYMWGAQLETGSTATAFQNVGTDKVSVFSGLFKSSTSTGVAVESSADSNTNNGTFGILVDNTAFYRYAFSSRGTTQVVALTNNTIYTSPNTSVATGLGNIGAPQALLRLNGADANQQTTTQGTGTYLSYPIYVGRRGGTTLPFNGRIFQLIVRGAATDSVTVGNAERWVGQLTGVAL